MRCASREARDHFSRTPAKTSSQTLGACGTAKIIATIGDSLNAGSRRWPFVVGRWQMRDTDSGGYSYCLAGDSTETKTQKLEITLAADAMVPFKTVNTHRLVANQ
jgi:hypothetical protein